jgi:hypothetical protein
MASVLSERTSLDETETLSTELAYKSLLTQHRDAMVTRLIEVHEISPVRAAAMIDQLWARLTTRIVDDHQHLGIDLGMAERIMNEALGFISLLARDPGHGPAGLVDIGWHTIILYTLEYEVLCNALAGHMIHHCPTDLEELEDSVPGGKRQHKIADTVAAMQRYGPVDLDLWFRHVRDIAAKCSGGGKCQSCDPGKQEREEQEQEEPQPDVDVDTGVELRLTAQDLVSKTEEVIA